MNDELYFRQLLAGRDFARAVPAARQMANFVYLVGDRTTGVRVVGALVTHYHPDHVGGALFGLEIEGLPELLERQGMKIHAQRVEAPWIKRVTGVSDSDLALHDSGDVVPVGGARVELVHTPGHTPGSQCFLVAGRLIAGDTLFLQGCGRTDLPGGDLAEMYRSLTQRLARIPDDTVLFPGHAYAPEPSAALGDTRQRNAVFKPRTEADWLRMFG